ncbi:hypothetical protein ACSQ67_003446 [Phaseolus vulgaris]
MKHCWRIVGKRYRIDGSKIMKIFLDPKERNNTEYKLETFVVVYRKLSDKDVVFEYPVTEAMLFILLALSLFREFHMEYAG